MYLVTDNWVKARLKKGGKISAAWCQVGSNITAEILGDSGFDVVVLDREHAPGDISLLITQIQALRGAPAIPFSRAPWNDFVQIKRILDAGVYGLLVPYVNTKKEAEAAVSAIRYPPAGIRGVAGSPRAPGYGRNTKEYLATADKEIVLMVAAETKTAAENLDQILTVEGVDGIFIGPMDLASSMGHPGNPAHPQVQEVIKGIEEKVIPRQDTFLATVAGDWQAAKKKYEAGYQLVMFLSDAVTLGQVARERVACFKEAYPE